ncbi:homeobox-leucine zipper protein HOX3-like [Nicotiana tomentosiformis]|uniref:homeobox-leucine zipper protein HOX3-like n=1 Tax=Nicotiana tomentosiformis TaxID=4098 RepID=UPI00051C31F8|nr:homeobox-leucine zipper protein HOX3-like [Nicotiana tomentosiformis]
MAVMPENSTCLELTISIPGSSSSSSFPSSGEGGGYNLMRELDINQVPSSGNINEEEISIEEEEESCNINVVNGGRTRKKLRLTKEQSLLLEESFRQNHTLNPKQKEALAMQLKLKPRQVEVWFQNRRARSKLKQTELECEYLKRWFGSLTEQNRRLKKEVQELRATKVGPPTVLSPHSCQPRPAPTLTMCPHCERVTATIIKDESKI